jgi:hypothetical protein
VYNAVNADCGTVHRPTVIFGAVNQKSARAAQLPGELPHDLNW